MKSSNKPHALATIIDTMEEAVEQFFCTATLSTQGRNLYHGVRRCRACNPRPDQDGRAWRYDEQACWPINGIWQSLRNTRREVAPQLRVLTTLASFVQMETVEAITDQRRVHMFQSTFKAADAKKDAPVAAGAILVPKVLTGTSSKTCSKERYRGRKLCRTRPLLAFAPAETGSTSQVSRTLKCQ